MRYSPWSLFNPRLLEWEMKREMQDEAAQRANMNKRVISAGRAGILIDGELFRLGSEPRTATTRGWGVVPGDPDAGRGR